jgi:hypothetical protein
VQALAAVPDSSPPDLLSISDVSQNSTATEPADVDVPPTLRDSDFDKTTGQGKRENTENNIGHAGEMNHNLITCKSNILNRINFMREQTLPCEVSSDIITLMRFENLEMCFNERKNDHAKLMFFRQVFRDQQFHHIASPDNFDTFLSFKEAFINNFWTRINDAVCKHKIVYFELFKRCYL